MYQRKTPLIRLVMLLCRAEFRLPRSLTPAMPSTGSAPLSVLGGMLNACWSNFFLAFS